MKKKMDIKELISKLEKCKTTKSAKTILNKLGIKTEDGFGKSYNFYIDNTHYKVTKHAHDENCRVIKYTKWDISFLDRDISNKPQCFGYMMEN